MDIAKNTLYRVFFLPILFDRFDPTKPNHSMTASEQLLFCKRCNNRRMDMNQGLVCSITGSKADFEDSCVSFDLDERIQAEMENSPEYSGLELNSSISQEKIHRLRSEQNLSLGITGAT